VPEAPVTDVDPEAGRAGPDRPRRSGLSGMLDRFDELLGRPVNLRALVVLRMLIGPVVVLHLWPFLSDALDGRIYRDGFYEPYASWYPELPRAVYIGLLWLAAAAAVAMTLGLFVRVATAVTFAVVAYNLLLSTTHVHSNRAYLVIVLGILTMAGGPRTEIGPAWPLWLLRFEASVVYAASGFSKLVDPDWFGGTVTWLRTVHVRDELARSPVPGSVQRLLLERGFHTGAAKVIVLTELFIALALWWRGTRYLAAWLAVCFHIAIQATASVEVFSYLAVAALVVWAVPSTRDRIVVIDPADPGHRRFAALIRWGDLLDRFRVVQVRPSSADVGPGRGGQDPADERPRLYVIDRDGTRLEGSAAAVLVLSRLPLTAWFALPLRRWR
jgi:HTTM domain